MTPEERRAMYEKKRAEWLKEGEKKAEGGSSEDKAAEDKSAEIKQVEGKKSESKNK